MMHQNEPLQTKRTIVSAAAILLAVVASFAFLGIVDANTLLGQAPLSSKRQSFEGYTQPRRTFRVGTHEAGTLAELNVQFGDQVKTNQVIGKLDDQIQVSNVVTAQIQALMTGQRDALTAELQRAETYLRDLEKLELTGSTRPDEIPRAITDVKIAQAKLDAANEQIKLREAELERAKLQLDRRKIVSPINGYVSEVIHQKGEFISPGDPAVVEIVQTDVLTAVVDVSIEFMEGIKVGTPVRIRLVSAKRMVQAKVDRIAPVLTKGAGSVQIHVDLDNKDGSLFAGDRFTIQFLDPRLVKPTARLLRQTTW